MELSTLKVGIVGLPNAGKTTLFNALSRAGAQVAPYPFTTVEPNVGIAFVPDERLYKVADLAGCEKRVPATVRFIDVAGLVEGASKGEGLGNLFLSHIRGVDAILHVVRAFEGSEVSYAAGGTNPLRDVELIDTELRLADLEILEREIEKVKRAAKSGKKEEKAKLEGLMGLERIVENETAPAKEVVSRKLLDYLPEAGLLTIKPMMIVLNVGDEFIEGTEKEIAVWAGEREIPLVKVNAEVEAELAELEPEEAEEFKSEMGVGEASLETIMRSSYQMLGLITFFSIDSGECRGWSTPKGSTASEAAGRIHSDFEKGFVKAEVVHYHDFTSCGSFASAREKGLLKVEGRDYVVCDGDVIHFKFAPTS